MDAEIGSRLDRMERTLAALVAALAPVEEESGGAGFDDLVQALVELAVAVEANTRVVMRLSTASGTSLPGGERSLLAGYEAA